MKYLGKTSLSSLLFWFMYVSWYVVLIGGLFIGCILMVAMFSAPVETAPLKPLAAPVLQFKYELFHEIKKNEKAWQFFTATPAVIKVLVLIWMAAAAGLMLTIIKKARYVFKNFRDNIVFNDENVRTITKASKLLVWFSIMTFNFSSLLVSIILLIISDVFKNGAVLQHEHDLTI